MRSGKVRSGNARSGKNRSTILIHLDKDKMKFRQYKEEDLQDKIKLKSFSIVIQSNRKVEETEMFFNI